MTKGLTTPLITLRNYATITCEKLMSVSLHSVLVYSAIDYFIANLLVKMD